MTFTQIITQNENLINIGKALIFILLGIFLGFLTKYLLRRFIEAVFLKRFFRRDINVYETCFKILKIVTELIQWAIIIVILNYSLRLLEINFISGTTKLAIEKMPYILVFGFIVFFGIILAKIISSAIKKRNIDKKEEIGLIIEMLIVSAFVLTALEYVGIRATAITELYKVILYVVAAIVVIFFMKYELFNKDKKK